ncbi:cyclin-dependent kinase 2-interacting protein [Pimephales promelas]|nr:cyclin-dependent kinase 2-interacting protein [Pimephales promelas]
MSESTTPGKKGNLTGSARKFKDNAANWHNLIQKWELFNDDGSTIATKIVNLGLNKKSNMESDMVMEGGSLAAGDPSKNLKQNNQELEEECVKLQDVVDKMVQFWRRSITSIVFL